jgi:hypothetical protein
MKELLTKLNEENLSLVVRSADGQVSTYTGQGVSDLYRLSRENIELLRDATVADKVVGMGSAVLMSFCGVKKCLANVISQDAYALLLNHGISVSATIITPRIVNRTGTGRCPLEILLDGKTDLYDMYKSIEEFVTSKTK